MPDGFCFGCAINKKGHPVCQINEGCSKCDAVHVYFFYKNLFDQGIFFLQNTGVWKQRSRVRIVSQAQQDQIKTALLTLKMLNHFPLIGQCRFSRGQRCVNSKNLFTTDVQGCEKGFPGHPEIAVRMIGGYVAFVAKKEKDTPPFNFMSIRFGGEQAVQIPG